MDGLSDQLFIICLPSGGDNTEEDKVSGTAIADELAGPGGNIHDLPCPDRSMFIPDMHLPITFQDVIKFHGSIQHMGQRGLSRRYDRMGNAASKPCGFRDFIGMEEFAQERTIDYTFMGAVCNSSDEHRDLSSGSWDTQVFGVVATVPRTAAPPYRASL